MAAVEIYLLRHGETVWNAQGRFQGALNSPLTKGGRAQAVQLGLALAGAFHDSPVPPIHVSPLGRTMETAEIIAQQLPARPKLLPDVHLREVSVGAWDGLTHADIEEAWPGRLAGTTAFDWYFRAPDGEAFEDALGRARNWLSTLSGPVVAISHGLFGRVLRGAWLNLSRNDMLALAVPQDVVWHLSVESVASRRTCLPLQGGG